MLIAFELLWQKIHSDQNSNNSFKPNMKFTSNHVMIDQE